jgi:8-oxo-dGTP pyrophosphatase MutT (NUDIX family)
MFEFVESIIEGLKHPLPGERAHQLFAPPGRSVSPAELINVGHYREASVAVILCSYLEEPSILLIKRSPYDGVHGGQISFPGGKKEADDKNSEVTARRETHEEIGLILSPGTTIGKLSNVFIPVSSFKVEPHVYHIDTPQELTIDTREVEDIFMLPIHALIAEHTVQKRTIFSPNGTSIANVPAFVYENNIVWGATALILGELRTILLDRN